MNSLELVEKRLREIDLKLSQILRNQLVFFKTWALVQTNGNITPELHELLAKLEKEIERLEKDLAFPLEKALKEG
jgi:uncharacterized FlaG/YvyC family protein